jgi:SAM-dependent methyltransferase
MSDVAAASSAKRLARAGAEVTAIDLAPAVLDVARLHLYESGLAVDYREVSVETLAEEMPGRFDVITCMEMLEHVPDSASVVRACATLLKPGGRIFPVDAESHAARIRRGDPRRRARAATPPRAARITTRSSSSRARSPPTFARRVSRSTIFPALRTTRSRARRR